MYKAIIAILLIIFIMYNASRHSKKEGFLPKLDKIKPVTKLKKLYNKKKRKLRLKSDKKTKSLIRTIKKYI